MTPHAKGAAAGTAIVLAGGSFLALMNPFTVLIMVVGCIVVAGASRVTFTALPMRKREELEAGFVDFFTGQPIRRKKHIACLKRIAELERWHDDWDIRHDAYGIEYTFKTDKHGNQRKYDSLGNVIEVICPSPTYVRGITGATGIPDPLFKFHETIASIKRNNDAVQHTMEQAFRSGNAKVIPVQHGAKIEYLDAPVYAGTAVHPPARPPVIYGADGRPIMRGVTVVGLIGGAGGGGGGPTGPTGPAELSRQSIQYLAARYGGL